ncbi:MAG: metallophosphoesterase family protein [Candidatus Coatesbacteria bacterium]|nr:MAG: metallophosphoesterase family protein [Candidatus Coatesbacteria bacterium]
MRVAVISDIHANAEAFTAVLSDTAETGAEKMTVLGDIVGYGADPEACTQTVMVMGGDEAPTDAAPIELFDTVGPFRDALICAVMGNHDMGAFGEEILTCMRYEAVKAVLWQRTVLSAETMSFLVARPLEVRYGDALFVHASPYRPETFDYILSRHEAVNAMDHVTGRLFFVGHTHDPVVYYETGTINPEWGERINLEPDVRYVVNAGSVGQPRDRDPRACYVIWDMDADTLEFRRVEYDVEGAAQKIYDAGLPQVLGDRLFAGI